MVSKQDWRRLRNKLCSALDLPSWAAFDEYCITLYKKGYSGVEISEQIFRQTSVTITPRSVHRIIKAAGVSRSGKEAFQNAMARGRVVWQLELDAERRKRAKSQLPRGRRFEILKRDGFRCVACGARGADGALLNVDHIVAKTNGGGDMDENLRTLCVDCNYGKRDAEGEWRRGGGFQRRRVEEARDGGTGAA